MKAKVPGDLIGGLVCPKSPDAAVLLSCAVAAIIVVPLRNTSDAFPPVTFVATLVLFMAPGLHVSCWLLGDDLSSLARIPVGFVVSTGAFGLLGVPALILHVSIEVYLLAAGVVLCAFLAVAAWRSLRSNSRAAEPSTRDTFYGPTAGPL